MRGTRRFFSWEKKVFLVGFSLTIPRFLPKSKNRLNTSLPSYRRATLTLNGLTVNKRKVINQMIIESWYYSSLLNLSLFLLTCLITRMSRFNLNFHRGMATSKTCSEKYKHINCSILESRTCASQGTRNVCFPENLACFVFLKHPFRDFPFCLITDNL